MAPQLAGGGPSGRGWSTVDNWRCKFRYAAQHGLGWEEERRDPLVRGDLLHRGLAAYFARRKALQDGEDPNRFYDVADTIDLTVQSESDPTYERWASVALEAIEAHIAYVEATYDWQILDVENYEELWLTADGQQSAVPPDAPEIRAQLLHQPMTARHEAPYLHTMRYDLIVRSGRVILAIDHKSWMGGTMYLAHKKGREYAGSGQLLLMRERAAALYGSDFGGMWVNLVPLKPAASGSYLQTKLHPVDASVDAVRRAARQKVAMEQELALYTRAWAPQDWPGAMTMQGPCHDRYEGDCPYLNRCKRGHTSR